MKGTFIIVRICEELVVAFFFFFPFPFSLVFSAGSGWSRVIVVKFRPGTILGPGWCPQAFTSSNRKGGPSWGASEREHQETIHKASGDVFRQKLLRVRGRDQVQRASLWSWIERFWAPLPDLLDTPASQICIGGGSYTKQVQISAPPLSGYVVWGREHLLSVLGALVFPSAKWA